MKKEMGGEDKTQSRERELLLARLGVNSLGLRRVIGAVRVCIK